mgnify:CR=1 FL=1
MGVFDAFQIPYSALQRDHGGAVMHASDAGAGVVIRGGVARGVPEDWHSRRYYMIPSQEMRDRWEGARLDELLDGMTRAEFLRNKKADWLKGAFMTAHTYRDHDPLLSDGIGCMKAQVPEMRAANFPQEGHFTVVATPTVICFPPKKKAADDQTSRRSRPFCPSRALLPSLDPCSILRARDTVKRKVELYRLRTRGSSPPGSSSSSPITSSAASASALTKSLALNLIFPSS